MTAVVVAVVIILVGGAATYGFLLSVRRRPTSVSDDVRRFQSSLEAMRPLSDEKRHPDPGTMTGPPDGDG